MSFRSSLKRLAERATGTDRLREQRDAIAEKLAAATAEPEKAKPGRYANPYLAMMRADGFLPFPAIQPQAFLDVAHTIQLEAALLLEAAQAEFGRRCASDHKNRSAEDVAATAARLYRELRIGELTALAESPYGRLLDHAVDDGALADAVPNIVRLDIEIDVSLRRGEASGPAGAELTPAHAALEAQRDALIARLCNQPAEGLLGLRAKAHALQLATIQEDDEAASDIALRLSTDVLRLTADRYRLSHIRDAQPDPVLIAIEASRKAEADMALFHVAHRKSPAGYSEAMTEDAFDDARHLTREAVWATVPTTIEGMRALVDYARFQVSLHTGPDGQIGAADELFAEILGAFDAAVSAGEA